MSIHFFRVPIIVSFFVVLMFCNTMSAQFSEVHLDKDLLFAEGLKLVATKQYKEAVKTFEQVASIDSTYKDVFTNLSHMYILLEMFPQAEQAAIKELNNFPTSSMAYNNWGYALLRQEKYDEAILQLRRAVFFGNNLSIAYINLIDAYTITQNIDKAIEVSEEAIKKLPSLTHLYKNLAYLYLMKGNFDSALEVAKKIKVSNDDDPDNVLLEIEILGLARRFTEMSRLIDKALLADSENIKKLEKFANLYKIAQHHSKSIELYKKILVLQPENYNAAFNIGMGYSDLKRYAVSNTALEEALKLNPRSSQSLMLMAHNYLSLRNRTAARRCYEKLKEFDIESAEIILETIKNHR